MTFQEVLKQLPLFSGLSDKELRLIVAASSRLEVPRGDVVFFEGDRGDFLLVILRGRVKVVLLGKRGEELVLTTFGPGSLFGELAVLDGAPRSATVKTLEKTVFLQLTRKQLLGLIQRHPSIHEEILRHVCKRMRELIDTTRTLSMFDAYDRILRTLVSLACKEKNYEESGMTLQQRPSHQELARMARCRRETVSRAMKVLQENGYVTLTKRGLMLEARALKHLHPH